jgi:ketosteroid isomerase-like protein
MNKEKIIKYIVVPVVGILILVAYYRVNTATTGGSKKNSPIINAQELEANSMEIADTEKSKMEIYDEEDKELQARQEAWQRAKASDVNAVANNFAQVMDKESGVIIKDVNQAYMDSIRQAELIAEAIRQQIQEEENKPSPIPQNYNQQAPKKTYSSYKQPTTAKASTPKETKTEESVAQTNTAASQQTQPVRTASFNTSTFNSSSSSTSHSSNTELANSVAIKAVVFGDHKIRPGEIIKVRTTEEAVLGGKRIPRNTVIAAYTSGNGNRLRVDIKEIKGVQTKLRVYDTDNIEGINTPYDLGREAISDGAADATNDAINNSVNPISTSATGAIINSATNLISRSSRAPVVHVPDGYEIILK